MDGVAVNVTFRDTAGRDLSAQVVGRDLGYLMETVVELMEGLGWSLLTLSVGEPVAAEGGQGGGEAAT